MNNIPTVEQVLSEILSNAKHADDMDYLRDNPEELEYHLEPIRNIIKLHVEAALKVAIKHIPLGAIDLKESILNAYPLSNVK